MKKTIKLTETDLEKVVKQIIKEEKKLKEDFQGYKGGMTFGSFTEVADSVLDRYRIYRGEYWQALQEFNKQFPLESKKIRTIQPGE
jgi:hypothetical protein